MNKQYVKTDTKMEKGLLDNDSKMFIAMLALVYDDVAREDVSTVQRIEQKENKCEFFKCHVTVYESPNRYAHSPKETIMALRVECSRQWSGRLTYLAFWLDRLTFVSDGVSKPMADSRPKGPQLRLGHPRVGELLFCPLCTHCIALDLTVWSKLYSGIRSRI